MPQMMFDNTKFLDDIRQYIKMFHYSTKLPVNVNPKSMIDFCMGSFYGRSAKDNANTFSAKIHPDMKLRYNGNSPSPSTDGKRIFFNRNFFEGAWYANIMGIEEEFIPYIAVLFFHAVTCHESAHGKIIFDEGLIHSGQLFKQMIENAKAMHRARDFDEEFKNKQRSHYFNFAANIVEDTYIDRYLLPTAFGYVRRLYTFFLRTFFGMPALVNQCGQDFSLMHIHFLRNNDADFNSWLKREYPILVDFDKILDGVVFNSNLRNRSSVVVELYDAIVEWHNENIGDIDEPQEDEEEEETEEPEDEEGSGGKFTTAGSSGEYDEEDEDLKEFDKEAEKREQEIEIEQEQHATNHRWMESSKFSYVTDEDFSGRRNGLEYRGENASVRLLRDVAAFIQAFRYGRHKKAPYKTGQRDGEFDGSSLHRYKDGRIFAEPKPKKRGKSDTEVVLMNDVSGSTFSYQRGDEGRVLIAESLLSMGYTLHVMLRQAGISVASLAHTTEYDDELASEFYGIASHNMPLVPNGKPITTNNDEFYYNEVLRRAGYSGNCDGAALRFSAMLFDHSNIKSKKVVVMINDGEPAESHIMGLHGRDALVKEIEEQRKQGIIVISIAAIPQVYDKLCRIYGNEYTFRGYGKYVVEDSQRLLRKFMMN